MDYYFLCVSMIIFSFSFFFFIRLCFRLVTHIDDYFLYDTVVCSSCIFFSFFFLGLAVFVH